MRLGTGCRPGAVDAWVPITYGHAGSSNGRRAWSSPYASGRVAFSRSRYRVNEETHVSVAAQTPAEVRIAERYLSVLADVSRCAEAVRDGDWRQLAGAADDLCRRAASLAEVAGKLERVEAGPRADVVVNIVVSGGDVPQVARLLHPVGSATIAKTAMTDPFTHPGPRSTPGR
jgi:hypothetical protein